MRMAEREMRRRRGGVGQDRRRRKKGEDDDVAGEEESVIEPFSFLSLMALGAVFVPRFSLFLKYSFTQDLGSCIGELLKCIFKIKKV